MNATVQAGGRVEVVDDTLPAGIAVEVTIRLASAIPRRRSGLEILREVPRLTPIFRTAEEVDAYLNAERDEWQQTKPSARLPA